MPVHRQQWQGSMPRPASSKKNKRPGIKRVSVHTYRFRQDSGPPVGVRNLVCVGASPRRGHRRYGEHSFAIPKQLALRAQIAAGIMSAIAFARSKLAPKREIPRAQAKG